MKKILFVLSLLPFLAKADFVQVVPINPGGGGITNAHLNIYTTNDTPTADAHVIQLISTNVNTNALANGLTLVGQSATFTYKYTNIDNEVVYYDASTARYIYTNIDNGGWWYYDKYGNIVTASNFIGTATLADSLTTAGVSNLYATPKTNFVTHIVYYTDPITGRDIKTNIVTGIVSYNDNGGTNFAQYYIGNGGGLTNSGGATPPAIADALINSKQATSIATTTLNATVVGISPLVQSNGILDWTNFLFLNNSQIERPLSSGPHINCFFPYGLAFNSTELTNELVAASNLNLQVYFPGMPFVIDDGWSLTTNAVGILNCDSNKFPNGMAGVATVIRQYGFTPGLYYEPSTTSAGGSNQAGAFFVTNIYNAVQKWGFGAIKFDNIQQGLAGVLQVQRAWTAFQQANTNNPNGYFESGGGLEQTLWNNPYLAGLMPRGVTLRTEVDTLTPSTFPPAAYRATVNANYRNSGRWSPYLNGIALNSSAGGGQPAPSFVDEVFGAEAVCSSAIELDTFVGINASQQSRATNSLLYQIDLDEGQGGMLLQSNSTAIVIGKKMTTGQWALQIVPPNSSPSTVTVNLNALQPQVSSGYQVQDVWSNDTLVATFNTTTNFPISCLTNSGATLLLTPLNILYVPNVPGAVTVGDANYPADVSIGNGAVQVTNILSSTTNQVNTFVPTLQDTMTNAFFTSLLYKSQTSVNRFISNNGTIFIWKIAAALYTNTALIANNWTNANGNVTNFITAYVVATNEQTFVFSNAAPYTTLSNPTNSFFVNVLYTNSPNTRGLLVGSAVLSSTTANSANITAYYTNNGIGYLLPMQENAGLGETNIWPFTIPLCTNATFIFTLTASGSATGVITNTVLWQE